MANEFRIKHGLIVTGSSYFSESMFAPNLPEETAPDYYITWRQSDGRFEISQTSPAQASTMGCWDPGDAANAGEFSTNDGGTGLGSSATEIYINNEDNGGANQYSTLASIGKGSTITLYSGALSTIFTVSGIIAPSSNSNTLYWTFQVSYQSGDQYSVTNEACLGVSAAVASGLSTGQCAEFVQSTSFSAASFNSGEGGFDRVVSNVHFTPPFGTVDANVVAIFLNGTTNQGNSTKTFVQSFAKNDTISVAYGNKQTTFTVDNVGLGSGGVTALVNVIYSSGDLNYTISTGDTFNLCKIQN